MKIQGKNKINLVSAYNDEARDYSIEQILKFKKSKDLSFDADITVGIDPIVRDGDIATIPFRLLTSTIVGGGTWKATDFSDESVLREAVGLFNDKPVYLNHEMEVGNEVGYVDNARFTPTYTNAAGFVIPAGIDGDKNFDTKLYPDLVRKMTGKTPYIKSSSVTVVFEWEASHEFENENDFYWHIGEVINGEMVRRVVTKITEAYESSLVWLGADPYAGILDENGKVKFIDKAGIVGFSAETGKEIVDAFEQQGKIFVSYSLIREKNTKLKNIEKDMEFQKLIAEKLGISEADVTIDKIKDLSFISAAEKEALSKVDTDKYVDIASFKAKENEVTSLSAEVQSLKDAKVQLETENASLKFDAEFGRKTISSIREAVLASYTKSVDGKVNEVLVKEIQEEVSLEKLQAKGELFGMKSMEHFAASCSKCGSKDFSFRSSQKEDNDDVVIVSDNPVDKLNL